MAKCMGETLDAFVQRAIRTQLKIDSVVLEDWIEPTNEVNTYPIGRSSGGGLVKVLNDKGIEAEVYRDEDKNFHLKAPISKEDFEYIKEIQTNHSLTLRLPCSYEEYPSQKVRELRRMYQATSFSIPDPDK